MTFIRFIQVFFILCVNFWVSRIFCPIQARPIPVCTMGYELVEQSLGMGSANSDPRALLVRKGGLVGINEGETFPAGLGRGNMLWGVVWVRLG